MAAWLARWQGAARRREQAERWGWLALLALAPFFLFTSPATTPVLLVVPALLAVLWAGAPAGLRRTPLDWALLLMAAMVLVSLWATFNIAYSLPKIAGLVFGLGLFYAAVARGRAGPGGWAEVAAVYLLLGAGVAAVGLVGMRWSDKFPALAPLAAQLPTDLIALPGAENGLQPNEVAGVLVWVAPVALALAVALWLHFDALVHANGGPAATAAVVTVTLVALGSGAVLVLAQSRSALFGLGLAGLAMGLLAGRRARWVTLALLGASLVAAVAIYGPRLAAIYDYALTGTVTTDAASTDEPAQLMRGLNQRVEIWSAGVHGIEDNPVTGMGLNTFRQLMFQRYSLPHVSPDPERIGHAHNTWLQAALDLGLPGLVAYAAVWIVVAYMMLQVVMATSDKRRTPRPNRGGQVTKDEGRRVDVPSYFILHPSAFILRSLAIGILGALAGSFGYGLTDTVALGARPGLIWWLLLALAVLVWNQSRTPGVYLAPVGEPAAEAA